MKERDYSLDILKIMATCAVIKLHSGYSGILANLIHYLCGFAVPCFLMVSGALMLNRKNGVDYKYSFDRSVKIIILMIIWNVIIVLMNLGWKRELTVTLDFLKAINQKGNLWHFWYLWTLIFLQMLSPILYRFLHQERKDRIFVCTVILLFVCITCHFASVIMKLRGEKIIEEYVTQTFRVWINITYYWIGGLLYKLKKQCEIKMSRRCFGVLSASLIAFSLAVAVYQYYFCTKFYEIHTPANLFSSPVYIIWTTGIFFVIGMIKIKHAKVVSELVKISFGVYIIHPILISAVKKTGYWSSERWLINFIVISIVSGLLSYIISKIPKVNRIVTM